jgi:hypothetical protein
MTEPHPTELNQNKYEQRIIAEREELRRERDELLSKIEQLEKELATLTQWSQCTTKAGAELLKERDELRATVKLLRVELSHMAGYAMTVRMDRNKVVDGDIMCLQRQEWCEGLLNAAQDSANTLTTTAPKEEQ